LKSINNQDYKNVTQIILSNDGMEQYIKQIFNEASKGRKNGYIFVIFIGVKEQ